MAIDLRAGLGGGSYKPNILFSGHQQLSSGASGDIITLSAPAGKRVRLEGLAADNSNEVGISVIVDGTTIISGELAETPTSLTVTPGLFIVSQSGVSDGTISSSVSMTVILSDVVGEEIIVRKNSGSTSNLIFYSYSYGD